MKTVEKPMIVACIPALNREKTIASVIVQTQQFVDRVVVCDDGSADLTGEIARALGAVVVRHEKNMGYGAAIASLFREARRLNADVAVTLDGDGQHDPKQIPRLVEPLMSGEADFVIGSRFLKGEDAAMVPGYRKVGLKLITNLASNASYHGLTDAQSGFRAYGRKFLEAISVNEEGMGVSTEILMKAKENGFRVAEVPVTISYNEDSSTHNPLVHGLNVILSTVKQLSIKRPLIFYGIPGFISLAVALFFWVWTLHVFSISRSIETNITLIALGATMVGLMLMTTGLILWVLISVVREKT